MSLYSQFQTDRDIEKTGVFLEYGFNSKGNPIRIRIARAGGANDRYNKVFEAAIKPYRRQIQTDTMDNKVAENITQKVYAQTIVLDWENMEFPVLNEKGEPTRDVEELDFTVDNCMRLFKDLPDLWIDIQQQSQRAALFRQEVREADAKN